MKWPPMNHSERRMRRGVALISVMVVVTVVAASAAQLLYRQNIDIERSTRIMSREQAFLLVFGLETYARDLLARDSAKVDHYFDFRQYGEGDARIERWSWPIPNWDMPDEWLDTFRRVGAQRLEARVHDLSGLFNLNGVYQAVVLKSKGEPDKWEKMYEGLFKNLVKAEFGDDEANSPDADALWNSLVDWFDADDEVRDGGAEDDEYLNLEPPYLTGRRRMAWPDEIRLIRGFEGKVSERLLPVFSALPHPSHVRININTADAKLLRRMPGLAEDGLVGEIMSRRADKDFFRNHDEVKRFFKANVIQETAPEKPLEPWHFFDVKSSFFLFSACVRFGRDRPIEIQSLLWRDPKIKREQQSAGQDKVKVMQRRMGSGYYKGGNCKGGASTRALSKPRDEFEDDF